jgi:uncharacterized protein
MSDRLYKLTQMHRRIDDEITREARALRPNPWRMLRLKKLRLLIKDRLTGRAARLRRA